MQHVTLRQESHASLSDLSDSHCRSGENKLFGRLIIRNSQLEVVLAHSFWVIVGNWYRKSSAVSDDRRDNPGTSIDAAESSKLFDLHKIGKLEITAHKLSDTTVYYTLSCILLVSSEILFVIPGFQNLDIPAKCQESSHIWYSVQASTQWRFTGDPAKQEMRQTAAGAPPTLRRRKAPRPAIASQG